MNDQVGVQEVLATEEIRCAATREGNVAKLQELLHEDYTHVTGRGSIMNRQQYIEWVTQTPRIHVRHGLQVQCFGDTALLYGGLTNHIGEPGENQKTVEAVVVQVVRKENGVWRFRSFQITPKRQ